MVWVLRNGNSDNWVVKVIFFCILGVQNREEGERFIIQREMSEQV